MQYSRFKYVVDQSPLCENLTNGRYDERLCSSSSIDRRWHASDSIHTDTDELSDEQQDEELGEGEDEEQEVEKEAEEEAQEEEGQNDEKADDDSLRFNSLTFLATLLSVTKCWKWPFTKGVCVYARISSHRWTLTEVGWKESRMGSNRDVVTKGEGWFDVDDDDDDDDDDGDCELTSVDATSTGVVGFEDEDEEEVNDDEIPI